MIRLVLVLSLATACTRDFNVPPKVAHLPLEVTGFSPGRAWSGARVQVTTKNLADTTGLQVRFGDSRAVTPVLLAGGVLQAVVPDDAASGPIAVSGPSDTASSAGSFTWLGLGHLRNGRIGTQIDLRAHVLQVTPFSSNTLAVIDDRYGWSGSLDTLGNTSAIAVRAPAASAWAATAGKWYVVDEDWGAAPCPANNGRLRAFDDSGELGTPICLPAQTPVSGADSVTAELAVDDDATHAFVILENTAYLVNLGTGSLSAPIPVADDLFDPGLFTAWIGGTKFVFTDNGNLRQLDWTVGTPTDPFNLHGPLSLSAQGPLVAVGVHAGVAYVYDATTWPPVQKAKLDTLAEARIESLALSPDGKRLAATQHALDRSIVFDVDLQAPLLSVPAEEAAAVTAWNGVFAVGVRGGVLLTSQQTGGILSTIPLSATLRDAVLRVLADGSQVIDVPSYSFNVLARLDATYSASPWHGFIANPIQGLQPIAGGGAAVLHDGEVRKLSSDGQGAETEDTAHSFHFAAGGFAAAPSVITSVPGGSAVLVQWDEGISGSGETVALLDATKPWDTAAVTFATPGALEDPAADEQGRLAIFGDQMIDVYDLPAALAGQKKLLQHVALPSAVADSGRSLGQLLLFLQATDAPPLFTSVSLADGTFTAPKPAANLPRSSFAHSSHSGFTVALGGRRLYWLDGSGPDLKLAGIAVDPDTGEPGDLLPAISLPAGVGRLTAHPDGEHILAVDIEADQLLVIE